MNSISFDPLLADPNYHHDETIRVQTRQRRCTTKARSELTPSVPLKLWVFPFVAIPSLWSWVLADDSLDLGLIRSLVPLEQVVRLSLGWGVWVWVVEEILHAKQDLFDGNGWLPSLLFVQD